MRMSRIHFLLALPSRLESLLIGAVRDRGAGSNTNPVPLLNSQRCWSDSGFKDKDKDPSNNTNDRDSQKSSSVSTSTGENYNPKEDSFFTQDKAFGSKENKGSGNSERPVFDPESDVTENNSSEEDLSPPTNCCQTGCPNCVWIDYVEKLSTKFTDPGLTRDKILKELEAIEDANIKAYIMMELRVRKMI